jgi:NADH:ubiquinone oxidoreductase subunit 5 (subunit L)/multisubunit Na+/H+ antiporter MnhA subunit
MEKEVVTVQSLDPEIIKKAKKAILFSLKPKWWLYIGLLTVIVFINWYTSPDESHNHVNTQVHKAKTDSEIWTDVVTALLPVIAFVVVFTIMLRTFRARNSKKLIEKKARYFTNVTYTINNVFFKKQGEGFENTYYWEEIYRIKETSQFYLIFSEKAQAHVIDKAQLDPWQLEETKEIFEAIKPKVKVSLK